MLRLGGSYERYLGEHRHFMGVMYLRYPFMSWDNNNSFVTLQRDVMAGGGSLRLGETDW